MVQCAAVAAGIRRDPCIAIASTPRAPAQRHADILLCTPGRDTSGKLERHLRCLPEADDGGPTHIQKLPVSRIVKKRRRCMLEVTFPSFRKIAISTRENPEAARIPLPRPLPSHTPTEIRHAAFQVWFRARLAVAPYLRPSANQLGEDCARSTTWQVLHTRESTAAERLLHALPKCPHIRETTSASALNAC